MISDNSWFNQKTRIRFLVGVNYINYSKSVAIGPIYCSMNPQGRVVWLHLVGGVTTLTKSHNNRDLNAQNPRNVMIINVKSLASMNFSVTFLKCCPTKA